MEIQEIQDEEVLYYVILENGFSRAQRHADRFYTNESEAIEHARKLFSSVFYEERDRYGFLVICGQTIDGHSGTVAIMCNARRGDS